MSEQKTKTFINGVFINEREFSNGGSILKISIPEDKIDALAAQLRFIATDGWARLAISKNQKPSISKTTGKIISTHSLSVDDWKPTAPAAQKPASDDVDF
jgi:hypothetical protein